MAHQPMSGGIETRISTGRPLESDAKERKIDTQIRHKNALIGAMELAVELQNGSPGFRAIIDAMRKRLAQLASEDLILQTLQSVLVDYRYKLEILPRLTEDQVRRAAGPSLSAFIEEPQVAPEGIPA